jgi:hypothetical protein
MPKPYVWGWLDYLMFAIIVLMIVMWPVCRAKAQPVTAEFKLLSPGHDGQVQGVGRIRYYLLKEYLELAQFDSELVLRRAEVEHLLDVETTLRSVLVTKDTQIQALVDDKQILADRSLRLEGDWQSCEQKLVECQAGSIWPYVVAISGVVLGAAAGVTIIVVGK